MHLPAGAADLHLPRPPPRQARTAKADPPVRRRRSPSTPARGAPSFARSRSPMTLKGRHWVMLWLALFLGVAAAVQLRQTAAIRSAGRLARLRQERITLESRQADLERRIREASSRQVLGRKAQEDLHLHFPTRLRTSPPRPARAGGGALMARVQARLGLLQAVLGLSLPRGRGSGRPGPVVAGGSLRGGSVQHPHRGAEARGASGHPLRPSRNCRWQ